MDTGEKKLKPSKQRILLWDGRELQFHRPHREGEAPIDLRTLLPDLKGRPLEVEIGPGKGEFLARRAAARPDRFFVGIDRRADRVELTERKLQRLGPDHGDNWIILREDARSFLEAGLPPLHMLHLYQPDPWPKSRHHKHRFFRSPEARVWSDALISGAEFRFSTDHREYFEEMLDIVKSWKTLRLAYVWEKRWLSGPPMTHFEGIFLRRLEPVYKAVFVKL
jgi:tRNA (guanine-N7-)-methyltransferase